MNNAPDECEACENKGPLKLFMAMWMCSDCVDKNKLLSEQSASKADERLANERERATEVQQVGNIIRQAMAIDSKIEVKSDLFNAETVSIVALATAIADDPLIPEKDRPSKLAELLLKRYQTYKEKIFSNQNENVELANKQSAIHKYLNDLKNQLTEVERERYKLLDVNYQPNKAKIANKPINSPAKPKKYDKAEILKAAQRANVPTSVIQMLCVAKNMTPMQASDSLLGAGSKPIEGE